MTQNKDIIKIADHHGLNAQCNQLVEEMAELMVALNKLHRKKPSAIYDVAEEIADVEIMLEQIKYLLILDEGHIADIKRYKISRELKRMKNEMS